MTTPETLPAHEFQDELLTPEEKLEFKMLDLQAQVREAALTGFTDPLDAAMASDELITNLSEQLSDIKRISKIPVRLSGEGVFVPEYELRGAEDSEAAMSGLAVMLSSEKALRALEPLETRVGFFGGMMGSVIQTEGEEEKYEVLVRAIFGLADHDVNPVSIAGTDTAIMDIVVRKRALVEMSKDFSMVPVELEALRERHDLADRIAQSGLANGIFMRHLSRLRQALHSEDEIEFTALEKIDIIKRIGSSGALYSRQNTAESSIVSAAIMDAVGHGRAVQVEYTELFEEVMEVETKARGILSFVIMPEGSQDETEPAMVVDEGANRAVIPFEKITGLKF